MGQQEIHNVLKKEGRWMDAEELKEKVKINNVSSPLRRLRKHGEVFYKEIKRKGRKGAFPKYIYKAKG